MEDMPIFFLELEGETKVGDKSPGIPTGFEVVSTFELSESLMPRMPEPRAGGDKSGCRKIEDVPIFFLEPEGETKVGDESPGIPTGFEFDGEFESSASMMPRMPDPRAGGEMSGKRK
jgi:hypothetical protein